MLADGLHGPRAAEDAPPAGSPLAGLPASPDDELRELRRRVEALEGRLFIPFGEEHTTYRPPQNPLITTSAGFSYGWDEGLLFTGELGRLEWAAAVFDGARDRGIDEIWDKAVNVKVSHPLGPRLDLSASFMRTGETAESALMLASGAVTPVGADGALSTAGASTSEHVKAWLYQGAQP